MYIYKEENIYFFRLNINHLKMNRQSTSSGTPFIHYNVYLSKNYNICTPITIYCITNTLNKICN